MRAANTARRDSVEFILVILDMRNIMKPKWKLVNEEEPQRTVGLPVLYKFALEKSINSGWTARKTSTQVKAQSQLRRKQVSVCEMVFREVSAPTLLAGE
jgi:hypothetical protein